MQSIDASNCFLPSCFRPVADTMPKNDIAPLNNHS